MIFDGKQIAEATRGTLAQDGPAGPILTDSRRVTPGSWYVALAGERFDGHDFLAHAAAAGCAGAVVSRRPEGWTRGLVLVPDTLVALQDLGRAVRRGFHGPVVGITGSAGKTSTRVMIVEVLRALGRVHHTEGNLNNHIGLPLTLLATPPDADVMVLEMGMNHRGEIALLQEIGAPNVRVITNVGAAHVEGCGSIEGVALAKQEMFDGARAGDVVCVNDDDPRIRAMPVPSGVRVVRYGRSSSCDVRLTDVAIDPARLQTRLRIETPDGPVLARLDVPGAHLAINAAAAVAVAYVLRVPVETMGPAIARFQPEGMRNRFERIGRFLVMDDAYNANAVSMAAALDTLAALPGPRIAVLGDILELGPEEAAIHRDVLLRATSLPIDRVFVTGPRMAAAASDVPGVRVFSDVDALAATLADELPDATPSVLVKGSRGARMERVTDRLRAPGGK
jgi:UDP-N-acetylmuramoyl-tripeptide--D-alanyl-D-alanine ligase